MKKSLLLAAVAATAFSASAATQVLFNGTETGAWTFGSGSTVTYQNNTAVVEMGEQTNGKFRADISYAGDGVTFDPATAKYFSLEFVGEVPQANISLEIQDPTLDFGKNYYKKNNFQGSKFVSGNNTVVYCELATTKTDAVDGETRSYADASTFTSQKINIKIADNTAEPHAYTLASIKLASNLTELGLEATVNNETTGEGYATLEDAFNAANDSDVIVVNKNIELAGRINFTKPIIIKGKTPDVCINRNFNAIAMLINAEVTLENITLSSKADEMAFVYAEVNKTGHFRNVTVKDVHSTKDQGILAIKGGKLYSDGLTFTNCASTHESCPGVVFLGTNGTLVLDGANTNVSVTIEKGNASLAVGENFTTNEPIEITYKETPLEGNTVVRGSHDASLFTLVGAEPLVLVANADANTLEAGMPGTAEKAITNKTNGFGYNSLEEAFAAIADSTGVQQLVINRDIVLTSRLTVPCPVEIIGATQEVKILRNFKGIMLLVNAQTTFKDITLASTADVQDKVFLEVNKVLAAFDNVIIADANSSHNQGVIALKQGGKLDANNLTFSNCSCTNEDRKAVIFYGVNGAVKLNGKIENASVFVEQDSTVIVAGAELSVNEPIVISFANPDKWGENITVVEGTSDASLFTVVGVEPLVLAAAEGDTPALILKEDAGIDAIFGDENADAPAEYFDLSGRRVANPAQGGIYIVRKGTKAYKVAF